MNEIKKTAKNAGKMYLKREGRGSRLLVVFPGFTWIEFEGARFSQRRSVFVILPVEVFGSSSLNSTNFGTM